MRNLSKNLFTAFLAQGVSLAASIIMSIIVPKLLSVDQFGYWQLFLLYNSYVGIFLLGLNGGIYLIEGGKTRQEIDKDLVGSQIIFGIISQICCSLVFIFGSFLVVHQSERLFVCIATFVYLVISNTNDLIGYLFQAINETRVFSFATVIDRVLFLLSLSLFVFVFRIDSFYWYVIVFIVTKSIALGYSVFKGWDFIFNVKYPINSTIKNVCLSIKVGIKLSLSTVAGSLILGICRFLIDYKMGISIFGQVSFALSMANFFLVFSAQFAMVIFPELRRFDNNYLSKSFVEIDSVLSLILPFIYILYFPLSLFIDSWLPQYGHSLIYLGILLPLCIYDGKMNIVGTTFFKVLRKENILLIINFIAMMASLAFSLFNCFILGNIYLILIGAVIVVILRSLYSEFYFYKFFNQRRIVSVFFEFFLMILFYISLLFSNFFIIVLIITYLFYIFIFKGLLFSFVQSHIHH